MDENNGSYLYVTVAINGSTVNRDIILPWYWKKSDFENIET